jgi:hypothetical protein
MAPKGAGRQSHDHRDRHLPFRRGSCGRCSGLCAPRTKLECRKNECTTLMQRDSDRSRWQIDRSWRAFLSVLVASKEDDHGR